MSNNTINTVILKKLRYHKPEHTAMRSSSIGKFSRVTTLEITSHYAKSMEMPRGMVGLFETLRKFLLDYLWSKGKNLSENLASSA